MMHAGVPLPDAMQAAIDGCNNGVYADALGDVRDAMLEGEGMARPIIATGLFPPAATQMMRVGEETGTLDAQMDAAADFFAKELDYKLARLTALAEPAVIIVMGVIVGFVAVALVSAMYGIFHGSSTLARLTPAGSAGRAPGRRLDLARVEAAVDRVLVA